MVVETAVAAIAAEGVAEAVAEVASEVIAESSISGAAELSETLSAIQKEVPREIINERVDAILQDEAFRAEILEESTKISIVNDHLEGSVHPETKVPFIKKEVEIDGESKILDFPDFSEHCRFETQLPENLHKANDYQHSKYCNEQLRQAFENGSLDPEQFTDRQRERIRDGYTPERYTWHHHEDLGRMQLVDSEIHAKTPHIGGRSLWGGGREAR